MSERFNCAHPLPTPGQEACGFCLAEALEEIERLRGRDRDWSELHKKDRQFLAERKEDILKAQKEREKAEKKLEEARAELRAIGEMLAKAQPAVLVSQAAGFPHAVLAGLRAAPEPWYWVVAACPEHQEDLKKPFKFTGFNRHPCPSCVRQPVPPESIPAEDFAS